MTDVQNDAILNYHKHWILDTLPGYFLTASLPHAESISIFMSLDPEIYIYVIYELLLKALADLFKSW